MSQQVEAAKLALAIEQNEELLGAITECLTLNRLHDAVSYSNRLQHNLVLLLQLGDSKPGKKTFRSLLDPSLQVKKPAKKKGTTTEAPDGSTAASVAPDQHHQHEPPPPSPQDQQPVSPVEVVGSSHVQGGGLPVASTAAPPLGEEEEQQPPQPPQGVAESMGPPAQPVIRKRRLHGHPSTGTSSAFTAPTTSSAAMVDSQPPLVLPPPIMPSLGALPSFMTTPFFPAMPALLNPFGIGPALLPHQVPGLGPMPQPTALLPPPTALTTGNAPAPPKPKKKQPASQPRPAVPAPAAPGVGGLPSSIPVPRTGGNGPLPGGKVWSDEEHEQCIALAKQLGWSEHARIAGLLKTKTRTQVRSHLQKFREKLRRAAKALDKTDAEVEEILRMGTI